jgi:EpsI family protein
MLTRSILLSACFLAGSVLSMRAHQPTVVPVRESLASLPYTLMGWGGRDLPDMSDQDKEMLMLTDYAARVYVRADGSRADFYVGYHATGGFHSPLNCLPGGGWIPVRREYRNIAVTDGSGNRSGIEVNRLSIVKGTDKQVVLYWYQGCGRVVASEYWGLLYGMIDKMSLGRTDAALVRVIVPAASLDDQAEARAESAAVEFVQSFFPLLERYIPD